MSNENLEEVRCPSCTHLLFKGHIKSGAMVEIKCPSCKNIIAINGETMEIKAVTKRIAE